MSRLAKEFSAIEHYVTHGDGTLLGRLQLLMRLFLKKSLEREDRVV